VIGLLREKNPHEMLEALDAKHAAYLLCCRPPSPRALDPADVAAAGADLGVDPAGIETFDSVEAAVDRARAVTADDAQIVVTGSLYTVGAARHALVHPSDRGPLH
jgi:dihydrofolate synthase/folylpolyglutamate synthase